MKFSEILTNERKKRGWSQETIAQKLDISRQSISKWENDEAYPDLPKLIKLSEILELSLDQLCGNKDFNLPKKTKKKTTLLTSVFILMMICSFVLGRLTYHPSNSILNDIEILDIKIIYEQRDDSFHFEFIPSLIDDKICYEVELIYKNESRFYESNLSGSIYQSICKAQVGTGPYHLNLIIKDKNYKKIIPITTDLYGEGADTRYTPLIK